VRFAGVSEATTSEKRVQECQKKQRLNSVCAWATCAACKSLRAAEYFPTRNAMLLGVGWPCAFAKEGLTRGRTDGQARISVTETTMMMMKMSMHVMRWNAMNATSRGGSRSKVIGDG
jgi:hypothetical protein